MTITTTLFHDDYHNQYTFNYFYHYHLPGVVVSIVSTESVGLAWIPNLGSRQTAHTGVHFPFLGDQ